MNNFSSSLYLLIIVLTISACTQQTTQILITIADARNHPAQFVDIDPVGDSIGDILVFEQPLLNEGMERIGSNSGTCVRVQIARSFQCQWTLTFDGNTKRIDSIQVAGREYDSGSSTISIVGGSGRYAGISGEMESTNNNDGTFTQVLIYRLGK